MYTVFIVAVFFVLLLLIAVFNSYSEYKRSIAPKQDEEKENVEYHKEKHKKIKAQYYRGIEVESKGTFITHEYNIVGLEKPHGKWTKMVMKRNLQYMSTLKNLMGNNFSKLGIWQLKVKAQSLISQAMHKGKGR